MATALWLTICSSILLLSTIVDSGTLLRPRHVRIGHHNVATHQDIVVETPVFSWSLDDEICPRNGTLLRGIRQTAYRLIVTRAISFYSPTQISAVIYDSGRVLSNRSTNILYDGPALISDTRYSYSIQYWSSTGAVSQLAIGHFRTALFFPESELTASWIGSREINMNELRREFTIPKGIQAATVFMSGMGYGILYVNGVNVDPSRRFDPGWTTYKQRVLYVSYDVTQFLKGQSTNCIGIQLGLGFFTNEQWSGGLPAPAPEAFGPPPRLLFQLNIVLSDQTTMNISSDTTWLGREGPHRKDSIYMGTFYDTRAERVNWSTSGFIDPYSLWLNASLIESPLSSPTGELTYQSMDPIRISPHALHIATSAARTGYQPMPPGVFGGNVMDAGVFNAVPLANQQVPTYDVTQNIAGYCTLTITGRKGMTVATRHAELLNEPGLDGIEYQGLNSANYQIITAADQFIIRGDPHERLEPLFTYHGFRYLSIYANYISIESVVCAAIHSETTLIGNFTSSSVVLNQIQHNVLWSQLSNIMSILTDCSQRQERRGWLGDASLSVDAALFNFDLYGLYVNFLRNIADVQHADGSIPDTAPYSVGGYVADPSWAHAYPEITWRIYQHYNDTAVVRQHYIGIQAWVDFLTSQAKKSGLANMYFAYGDWETPVHYPVTNSSLVSAFSYLSDVQTMITLSKVLNNQTNVDKYSQLYTQLGAEFHTSFYNSAVNGYAEGYQTANALALKLPDVVPSNLRTSIIKTLVDNIVTLGNHSATGIVGTAALFSVLSDAGYHDLAVALATQTTYPSFGFMFNNDVQNATTNWETYHALIKGVGGTDSLNHHMFNSIGAWFYRYLAGIQLNGFVEELIIHPRLTSLLSHVEAEVHTIAGPVLVAWQRYPQENTVTYRITIPHSFRSLVTFEPTHATARCVSVEESDALIWHSSLPSRHTNVSGILWIRPDKKINGAMSVQIEGGSYHWKVRWE
jgi:alpha-L-rhamnosidase